MRILAIKALKNIIATLNPFWENGHKNSFLPIKKPKNGQLSKEEKKENQRISKIRILVENVLALVKNFRIISGICRYRLNKIAKRFNLICGICNLKNV
jgi:DDE superfamily endonuclease